MEMVVMVKEGSNKTALSLSSHTLNTGVNGELCLSLENNRHMYRFTEAGNTFDETANKARVIVIKRQEWRQIGRGAGRMKRED